MLSATNFSWRFKGKSYWYVYESDNSRENISSEIRRKEVDKRNKKYIYIKMLSAEICTPNKQNV